jgi:hypothetical protein
MKKKKKNVESSFTGSEACEVESEKCGTQFLRAQVR